MRHAALLLCLVPSIAVAQQLPPLIVGARMRVDQAAATRVEGTLMAQTSDSLTIASVGAVRRLVPSANVMRISVSEGKKASAGFVKGAKIGATLGLIFGVLLVAAVADIDGNVPAQELVGLTATTTAYTAIWGGGIGAIVGAEKWTTVYRR